MSKIWRPSKAGGFVEPDYEPIYCLACGAQGRLQDISDQPGGDDKYVVYTCAECGRIHDEGGNPLDLIGRPTHLRQGRLITIS